MTYGMKGGDANRQQPKKVGKNKFAHTPDTTYGMGDYYGTGIKAKIGRVREGMGAPLSKRQVGNPPKSLA